MLGQFGDALLQFGIAGLELLVEPRQFLRRRLTRNDGAGGFLGAPVVARPGFRLRGAQLGPQRLDVAVDVAQRFVEIEILRHIAGVARRVDRTFSRRLLRTRLVDRARFAGPAAFLFFFVVLILILVLVIDVVVILVLIILFTGRGRLRSLNRN